MKKIFLIFCLLFLSSILWADLWDTNTVEGYMADKCYTLADDQLAIALFYGIVAAAFEEMGVRPSMRLNGEHGENIKKIIDDGIISMEPLLKEIMIDYTDKLILNILCPQLGISARRADQLATSYSLYTLTRALGEKDDFNRVASLAKEYQIQPSLAISIIVEMASSSFSNPDAIQWHEMGNKAGTPGLIFGDFSRVSLAESYTKEYRQYWLVRYIGYLHHPDMNFTPWQIAAAFYCGVDNVRNNRITSTGRTFADRVINNISLYRSYD